MHGRKLVSYQVQHNTAAAWETVIGERIKASAAVVDYFVLVSKVTFT